MLQPTTDPRPKECLMDFATGSALAHRYNDDFHNQNQTELADELFAPGFQMHLAFPGIPDPLDAAGLAGIIGMFHAHFTGLQHTIEDVVVGEDRVAFRWSGTARHTADFNGIPASGKAVTTSGITFFRVDNGQIADVGAARCARAAPAAGGHARRLTGRGQRPNPAIQRGRRRSYPSDSAARSSVQSDHR
jgi:steroid delta-isomerase-like uncharacterized protein